MKKFTLFVVLLLNFYSGKGQSFGEFIRMPLAYPNDGYKYSPESMSIVDHDHLWVATIKRNAAAFGKSYYQAAKTSDGGNSWQLFQIPATGNNFLPDVEAQSGDVCYYFVDNIDVANSDIWKTTDGGTTWAKKTSSEFSGSYGDFIHLFNNDTLIAVGDPVGGYFDIQLSNDGGETWSRVPQLNIPPILENECGLGGKWFSYIGNTIWFPTSQGRCYKSIDRGAHWTVSDVNSAGGFQFGTVCFSDQQHGIFYSAPGLLANYQYFKTDDGGSTWTAISIFPNTKTPSLSRIEGIYNGFVVATSFNQIQSKTYIYYTTDFFNTINVIDSVANSNKRVFFKDAETGWLGGINLPDSSILKYTGVLTSTGFTPVEDAHIKITPNPSSSTTLLTFPSEIINDSKMLNVFNISGSLISNFSISSKVSSIELNVSDYPDGVYIIQVISNKCTVINTRWMIIH